MNASEIAVKKAIDLERLHTLIMILNMLKEKGEADTISYLEKAINTR